MKRCRSCAGNGWRAFRDVQGGHAELAGKISDAEMQKMNYAVVAEQRDISEVAREFLHSEGPASWGMVAPMV